MNVKQCFYVALSPHPATVKLTYQFPAHPRASHYYLCAEHANEFSTTHLIKSTPIRSKP